MQRNVVTLEQVAEAAGVSMKTVSRVVNNSPQVAEATRERVQRAIRELNYQPNRLASSLASGHTNTVGVLVHHSVEQIFQYPFFNELLGGIAKGLNEHKFDILLRFMEEGMTYTELYDQRRVDGLIITNAPLDTLDIDAIHTLPLVFTSHIALDNNPSHIVDSDFYGGVQKAMDLLFKLEHRRIGLMAGAKHLGIAHFRIAGYRDALSSRGIEVDEALIQHAPLFLNQAEVEKRLQEYWLALPDPPTALIASDDVTAVNAIRALQVLGYRVPDDISVIGIDDTLLSRIATPQLTSIGQQAFLKGYTAATTLVGIITEGASEPVQINLEMTLQVRDSTGPAPVRST